MTLYTLDLDTHETVFIGALLTEFISMATDTLRSAHSFMTEERAETLRAQLEVATRLKGKLPVNGTLE